MASRFSIASVGLLLLLSASGCDSNEEDSSDLIGYWSFDDGTGRDNSGSGHNGTVFGSTLVEGVVGSAIDLDGIDDFVDIPHSDDFNVSEKTILFWFFKNNDSINDQQRNIVEGLVFKSIDTSIDRAFSFELENPDIPFILLMQVGDGANLLRVTANDPILPRQWYHVAGVLKETDISLYVNGAFAGRTAFTGGVVHNTAPIILGKASVNSLAQRFFNGKIDELRFYRRTLSESEIRTIFEQREPN